MLRGKRKSSCIYIPFFVFLIFSSLSGCSSDRSHSYSQDQLQSLVDSYFLSPQIRALHLLPVIDIQLYLSRPRLQIRQDGEPLAFSFQGQVDARVAGATTDPVPFRISGYGDLRYSPVDQAFYLDINELLDASIELDVAMFQTLMVEQLQNALHSELQNIPIISLSPESELLRKIDQRNVTSSVINSRLEMFFKP